VGAVGTKHSFEDRIIVIGVPKCNLGTGMGKRTRRLENSGYS
jgi:hypothetical protein